MTNVSIPLPESIIDSIRAIANQDGFTVESFLASAASEKLAVFRSVDYLKQRAEKANLEEFREILESVPAIEPEPHDKLPEGYVSPCRPSV